MRQFLVIKDIKIKFLVQYYNRSKIHIFFFFSLNIFYAFDEIRTLQKIIFFYKKLCFRLGLISKEK